MRCDNCQFYSHKHGECREQSPVKLLNVEAGKFPRTERDSWCGRFRQDGTLKTYRDEISIYRHPSYVEKFGVEVSDRQCERGIAAIAERKSR